MEMRTASLVGSAGGVRWATCWTTRVAVTTTALASCRPFEAQLSVRIGG